MRRMILAVGWCCLLAAGAGGANLSQAVADRIMTDFGFDPDLVTVTVARLEPAMADTGECEVRVVPQTQGTPKGRFSARVELYRQGELVQQATASIDVRFWADLLVPVRNINRGEMLSPDLFTAKRFDVTAWTEPMLAEPAHLSGCRAKNILTAGRQVGLARLEKIPDVSTGGTVTLVGTVGILEIRAKGVALQNGAIGETIAVRNTDSGKVVSGKIIASGAVAVAL
jgi:flagellar basal body P-ring formation protein FlgA